jgi:predicted NUDIX family NTP pyrophosphohydrolase
MFRQNRPAPGVCRAAVRAGHRTEIGLAGHHGFVSARAATRSSRRSAGLLLYRRREADHEVLLVHPGGPMWARRDAGAWSIPKGEYQPDEDPLAAARREFTEELGVAAPEGEPVDLGEVRQRSGKLVRAFAVEGELDAEQVISNTCEIEWPPRSGRRMTIPEVDRAGWFDPPSAAEKLIPGQTALLDRLAEHLR